MSPLFCLVQIILGTSCDNLFLMLEIKGQHLKKIHYHRLLIHKGKHIYTKSILKLGMLKKLVQHHIWVDILPQFNANAHTFPVGFIPQLGNTIHFFILMKFGDLFNQSGFIDHVGKFCHNDTILSICHRLYIGHRSHTDFSPSCAVSFLNARAS